MVQEPTVEALPQVGVVQRVEALPQDAPRPEAQAPEVEEQRRRPRIRDRDLALSLKTALPETRDKR